MSGNLKVLGLALLATLAMSAFGAVGAAADPTKHTGGHFTVDPTSSLPISLLGHNGDFQHRVHWILFNSNITCTDAYSGEVTASTVTSIAIAPTYTNCGSIAIRMNGCTFNFTVRETNTSTLHNPVELKCPAGKDMEFEFDAGCPFQIGEQTVTNAATYTTALVNGKHALTIDLTMTGMSYEKHGWCVFKTPVGTGPHGGFQIVGSLTLSGTDALGNPAGITATGTNSH